jgi:hypothetical protein
MRAIEVAAALAIAALCGAAAPASAGEATRIGIAQATPPAAPDGAPSATKPADPAQATSLGTATKPALSIPGCSVRFLEAKVAGKLNGRKWRDFRRDECGATETTAVFPTAVAQKYAGEKDPERARTRTCADQFTANKATNANGGLKWIEKTGGYYAECVARLME